MTRSERAQQAAPLPFPARPESRLGAGGMTGVGEAKADSSPARRVRNDGSRKRREIPRRSSRRRGTTSLGMTRSERAQQAAPLPFPARPESSIETQGKRDDNLQFQESEHRTWSDRQSGRNILRPYRFRPRKRCRPEGRRYTGKRGEIPRRSSRRRGTTSLGMTA